MPLPDPKLFDQLPLMHDSAEQPGDFRWFLKSTEHSSTKYGPCEVCNKHCSEVYHQWCEVAYWSQTRQKISFTYYRAPKGLFGHLECLMEARKTATLREPE